MSGPNIQPLLEGRKTQTRRIIKLPGVMPRTSFMITHPEEKIIKFDDGTFHYLSTGAMSGPYACPYGQPGQRLWVRESGWEAPYQFGYVYDAINGNAKLLKSSGWKRRPSIFMPRWASRLLLEITDVRVERLNEISEEDAKAEGVSPAAEEPFRDACGDLVVPAGRYRNGYRELWESINGAGRWDANPWVWVIAFKNISNVPHP